MKKIINLVLCSVLMTLTCAVYAENDALSVYGAEKQSEGVVFTFMRKHQLIAIMSLLSGKTESMMIKLERDLPFHRLFDQLHTEATKLEKAEQKLAEREIGNLEDIQKEIVKSNTDFLELVEKMREVFKGYPALAEMKELEFATLHDVLSIFADLAETEIKLLNDESLEALIRNLSSKMSENEVKELIGLVFADEVEQYKAFVETNKDVLEKISAFADNGFKMTIDSKKCRTVRGKEFCTSGKEEREIKTLSEILPYINSVVSTKSIEAGEL